MLQSFRTQVAAASGIESKGRCATTAIAVAFKVDPAIELFKRLLVAFARWSRDVLVVVERLRSAWRSAYAVIVKPGALISVRSLAPHRCYHCFSCLAGVVSLYVGGVDQPVGYSVDCLSSLVL